MVDIEDWNAGSKNAINTLVRCYLDSYTCENEWNI